MEEARNLHSILLFHRQEEVRSNKRPYFFLSSGALLPSLEIFHTIDVIERLLFDFVGE